MADQEAGKIYNIKEIGTAHFGDNHYYGEKKIPRHLTPPPFQTEVFLGREEE